MQPVRECVHVYACVRIHAYVCVRTPMYMVVPMTAFECTCFCDVKEICSEKERGGQREGTA